MKKCISTIFIILLLSSIYNAQTTGLKSYYKVSEGNGGFPTGLLNNSDYFGFASEGIGDLDGDGIEDVAVGAIFDDDGITNAGAVWILFLNLDGSVKSHQKIAHNVGGLGAVLGNTDVFGSSIANIGDIDNDGVIDLAVGAYNDPDGGSSKGAVYILRMNTDGTVKAYQKISHTTGGFTGSANTYYFGMDVDGLGDLDGDGIEDIVVGAPHDNDGGLRRGAVWILFLDTNGTVKSEQKISDLSGSFSGAFTNDDRFGYGVSNVGDVNFDGIVDISIGAFYDDDGGTNKGAVWFLFLDSNGTVQDYSKIASGVGGFPSTALANADLFGISTQPLGDINGDGLNDILVGADLDDDGGTNRGAFYLINLDSNAEVGSYQKISDTSSFFTGKLGDGDRFGASISRLGDINNDGIVDFVVSARSDDDGGTDKGAYYMMSLNGLPSLPPLMTEVQKISHNTGGFPNDQLDNSDWFGYSSEGIGDLDGDGVEDLAVGSYLDDDGFSNAGAVYILFLNEDGTVKDYQKIANNTGGLGNVLTTTDVFGNSIENIGDLDGDGVTDIAVGSYLGNDGGSDKGSVYILFLTDSGYVKSYQEISDTEGGFEGVMATYSGLGTSIANIGDLDSDGITDLAVGAWADTDGGSKRGAVWIFFMNTNGTVKSFEKISDTQGSFEGTLEFDDRFGYGVESINDLDGDGIVDIAVTSLYDDDGATNAGAIWILFLDTNGSVKSYQKISMLDGDFSGVLGGSDLFGLATQYMGDIDGDGKPNLLVTARNDDDGGTDIGAVWMLNLNTDGTVSTYKKISDEQGGFGGNLANSDWFGSSVSMIGDLNNDGFVEFAIGAEKDDDGGTDRGAVYIISFNPNYFTTFEFDIDALAVSDDYNNYRVLGMGIDAQYNMRTSETFSFSSVTSDKSLSIDFTSTDSTIFAAIEMTFDNQGNVIDPILTFSRGGRSYQYRIDPYITFDGNKRTIIFNAIIADLIDICLTDAGYSSSWTSSKSYDENGTIIAESKTYLDDIGRPIQNQARNFSTNGIMASETIYDSFGRSAISTLAAPVYNGQFCFKSNFVTGNSGQEYNYTKFDLTNTTSGLSGEIDNPYAVDNTVKGTLGWYFSKNNDEEPFQAESGFPYSRVEYYPDPLGRPKRTAAVGENYKMGSNHETQIFYGTAGFELDYVYNQYFQNERDLTKMVATDADGLVSVIYKDALNNVIATCYSELDNDCYDIPVTHQLDYYKGRSVNIHFPNITGQGLYFWLNYARDCNSISYVNIKITDLITGKELKEGASDDYTVASSPVTGTQKYLITFVNPAYQNKTLYLSLSYDYTAHYINNVYPVWNYGPYLPYQGFQYKLDYSHWTLNYYDTRGRLSSTIPPEGVDCNGINPNVGYAYELDWKDYDYYDYPTDVYTFNSGVFTNNFYNFSGYDSQTPGGIFTDPLTEMHQINLRLYPSLKPINYSGGCESGGTDDPTGIDDDVTSRQQVNAVLEFMERNTSYSNSRMYTSDNIGDIDSNILERRVPVLIHKGQFVGTENFKVSTGSTGGGSAVFEIGDPFGPCDGLAHCSNGIQDCDETQVDYGNSCYVYVAVCDQIPPVLVATYQLEIELTIENGGGFMYVKPDGTVTSIPYSYYIYPQVYKTCECEYYWDYSSFTSIDVTIYNNELNTYEDGIHANLKSINVRKDIESSITFDAFDQADYIHDFAQYLQLRARLRHDRSPFLSDQISHSMGTIYEYDELNELTSITTPDQGETENVYDIQGNLRFTQNAQQKIDKKFSYNNYDRAGRSIESGIYDYTNTVALQFQNQAAQPVLGGGETSVLTVLDDIDGLADTYCSEQSFTLYDIADVNTSDHYPFATSPYTNYKQSHLLGRVSKTWNEHSIMWYGYDMYGRVLWTIEYIEDVNIATHKTIDYEYDEAGNVVNKTYQKYDVGVEYFEHRYTYDNGQQLTKVETSSNGIIYYDQANYSYYQHGSLKRTEIGGDLQGIDYIYTAEGKLKAINSPNLGIASGGVDFSDPGNDGGSGSNLYTDIFGMVIDYHSTDYIREGTHINYGLGTNQKFTGTINQVRWNLDESVLGLDLTSSGKQNVYQYEYNDFNWLTKATFGTYDPSCNHNSAAAENCPIAPVFTADVSNQYKVLGITYDRNGNIETLERNGNTTTGVVMDDLTYNYATITQTPGDGDVVKTNNRITYVSDAAGATSYTTDIESQSIGNYSYNAIGEITENVTDIETYTYFQSGLAKEIKNKTNGNLKLSFEYNAKGQRLKKYIYDLSGVLDKEIFYIRDLGGSVVSTYERDAITSVITKDFSITGTNLIGNFDPGTLASRYYMYDHLGNVRATFREFSSAVEVLSVNEFYPFGMVMPDRNSINSLDKINYGYQGQELGQTGLNAFPLRMYDARLGRWMRTDPFYEFHSSYLAMGNNPISFIDPSGGCVDSYDIVDGVFTSIGCLPTIDEFFDGSYDLWSLQQQQWQDGYEGSGFNGTYEAYLNNFGLNPYQTSQETASKYSKRQLDGWNKTQGLRSKYSKRDWQLRNKLVADGGVLGRGILANESNGIFRKLTDPRKPYEGFGKVWNKQGPPDLGETAQFWMDAATVGIGGALAVTVAAPIAIEEAITPLVTSAYEGGITLLANVLVRVEALSATTATTAVATTGAGTNVVYRGIDALGKVRYVGITSRAPQVRFMEHLGSNTSKALLRYEVIPKATSLSRIGARTFEQRLINQFGGPNGQLLNKINSISPDKWYLYGIK